jgi:hypothetical protein
MYIYISKAVEGWDANTRRSLQPKDGRALLQAYDRMLLNPRVDSGDMLVFIGDIAKELFEFVLAALVSDPTTTFLEFSRIMSRALGHLWLRLQLRGHTCTGIEHHGIREYATAVFIFAR